MNSWIVETKGLKKYYKLGNHVVKALDGVDFRVKEQEFAAIIGKSGSGKSTLLHMIGGLDHPTAGEVCVAGKQLSGMTKEELAVFRRRKVGFIFQNYNLVPDLRAAVARAIASKPSIILADEPTGNLDTAASHDVLGLLKMAAKQFQQTIVLITHDNDIAQMADRIVRIEDGAIVKGSDSRA